ncbi:MAG TPA: hypothetical protein VFY29_01485 [Terriglobia bacterium]|nr:hypothetical protein [Terriglobia bacterium]
MAPMIFWRRMLLTVAAGIFLTPAAHATELRIRFKGPGKEKVQIEKAEALLVGWELADRVPLPFEGDLVRVSFDSPELRAVLERFPNLISAFIHVRAKDLTPIVSDPFTWPGSQPHRNLVALGVEEVRIDFRRDQFTMFRIGDDQEMVVELKEPKERRIRFYDDEDKPVRGLRVAAYMFWANENRCGRMSGGDLIATGVTDDSGRFAVPDGDFEYAFKLLDPRVRFTVPDTADTDGYATAFLTQRETPLSVHWYVSRPLTLRVYSGDTPLANALVNGAKTYCSECGMCSGVLGKTDSAGALAMERYYPEEFDILCLIGADGAVLWTVSAYRLSTAPLDVRLPAGTPAPSAPGVCPPFR